MKFQIREPTDMPLWQVSEQLSAVDRFRENLPRGPLRLSCELAIMELENYKREFIEKYERETRRIRSSLLHTMSKERFDRDYVHPRLIIDGQPVLRLALYNIRIASHKGHIVQFLRDQGFHDVFVENVRVSRASTTATLTTKSLATSCRLQALSCLSRMKWHYAESQALYVLSRRCIHQPRMQA